MHVLAVALVALLLLAVLWLLLRNQLLVYVPDVQGTWTLETTAEESRSQACIGSHLWWVVHLTQTGPGLSGYGRRMTGEAAEGPSGFAERGDARFTLRGKIRKRLFGVDAASMRVDARGFGVEELVVLNVDVARGGGMLGRFASADGSESGVARWVRVPGSEARPQGDVGA